jgi:hypothetical protein
MRARPRGAVEESSKGPSGRPGQILAGAQEHGQQTKDSE